MVKSSTIKFEPGSFPMSKFMSFGMVICFIMAILCLAGGVDFYYLHPKLAQPYHKFLLFILFFGNLAVAIRCYQIRNDKIEIDDEGVRRVKKNGIRSSLTWKEISKILDKRTMQQFILSNASGKKRVVIDYQFRDFQDIRDRILLKLQ